MAPRYENRTLKELKELAKSKGMTGYSQLNKADLIKKLRGKSTSKFERCVKKVKAKQPSHCKKNKYKGKDCYNPWAVCHSSLNS